ncbi:MAG TPA: acyl-CoA dehydrogenase family protein [Acidimicrobiia bacterium]|nr:acyl-CoA dehydrogenase family protein [Acidimicrobiia bacterium]
MRPTITLPAEADRYRDDVRAFLREHGPGGRFPPDFARVLARAGFVAPHWPRPWGLDAGPLQQLAIDEELRRARAPRPVNPIGIGWAGPTLLVAGTGEQHERWLPGILDGSEIWCQLFSEPEAGSDLASLTTRARRDGDEWVVDGQKIWTTGAQFARWGILLARTDPDAEAHRGISYFVLDMRAPGIDVRPIKQMDGSSDFNEVFLDGVRVPAANLVGTEHDGWRLARVTLGNERVSLSGEGALWGMGPTAHDLVALVREHDGVRDATMRQRVARLYAEAEILRLIRMRTLAARLRGLEPGPEASVRKALADEHGQRVMALAVDLAGTHGMLADRGPFGSDTTTWAKGYLFSRALTIGGGTAEVQRNIVSERVLGLPRD